MASVMQWRNERHKHCQFPTQQAYDDRHEALNKLKTRLRDGEITKDQAFIELTALFGYGRQGAVNVLRKWTES